MPTASLLSARRCLELDHDLDRLAVVHRPVAIRHPVEFRYSVEDTAWLDPPVKDVRQQLVDVGAGRGRPAAHSDVLPEGDASCQCVVLRHTDPADRATRRVISRAVATACSRPTHSRTECGPRLSVSSRTMRPARAQLRARRLRVVEQRSGFASPRYARITSCASSATRRSP
jgi:hypothetical protein